MMLGLDGSILDSLDHSKANRRILVDVRSDFILAPHYNTIFSYASNELSEKLKSQLRSGQYTPCLPITMSVPKGRNFSRSGSILRPLDRLLYQLTADVIAPVLEQHLDRQRVFSHVLNDSETDGQMFKPQNDGWRTMKKVVNELTQTEGWFVRADVANYFERIPQHHLINLCGAAGVQSETVNILEKILLAYQEQSSIGIVQGIFPSDLLGNFFLSDVDAHCELYDIPSARYVDDLYLHFRDCNSARRGMLDLIERLRKDNLHLNESKSYILKACELAEQETVLDTLFDNAWTEVQNERVGIFSFYGFPDWGVEENEEENVDDPFDIAATLRLFNVIDDNVEHSEEILKFCLPFLGAAGHDAAVPRALTETTARPHLSRECLRYLAVFASTDNHLAFELSKLLTDDSLISDSQRMYVLASLMGRESCTPQIVNKSLTILQNQSVCQEARAIAAIFSAKYGAPQQRRTVRNAYQSDSSDYVRSAILYSSRYFTTAEKKTCHRAWGGHSAENALIVEAIRNQS